RDAPQALEAALDDDLRLGPRDQRAPVDLQAQAAEAPLAEDVRERRAPSPPLQELARRDHLPLVERAAVLRVQRDPREPERLPEQMLRVDARAGDALPLEELRRALQRLGE